MLVILHLSLMIAATLFFIIGIGMALFGRKIKFWLKWHKRFNATGFCSLAAAAIMAFANVATSDGHHLTGLHQWIGFAAIILTCITLFLGFYSFKAVNKPTVRMVHRWSGRLSAIAVGAGLILGLQMIGIL